MAATPKTDRLRELREAKFEKSRRAVKPHVNNAPATTAAVINGSERQRKWRDANPDLNRKRARDGMRKKRASSNDAA